MNDRISFKHFYFWNDDKQESKPVDSAHSKDIVTWENNTEDTCRLNRIQELAGGRLAKDDPVLETLKRIQKSFPRNSWSTRAPIRDTQDENSKDKKEFEDPTIYWCVGL